MKYLNIISVVLAIISSTSAAPAAMSKVRCGSIDGKCDPGYCCSKYGWCGATSDHCGKGCQSEFGTCNSPSITKTTKTSKPTSSIIWENKYDNDYVDSFPNIYTKYIWDFLVDKIENKYGAAGIIGNLYVKSRLNPANLEEKYEKKFNMNDEEYTRAVDNGSYSKFTTDNGGYGLFQWASEKHKSKLLKYAKIQGKSIGDLQIQLDFLWLELQDKKYENLLKALKTANSVQEASDKIVLNFEKPKDQSQDKLNIRAKYGKLLMSILDN
ncbi:carbohydrate-binding module family 18 protein [Piromyces sp. E2]|nr:carbohydrate-binding module family 18 protein [Piromyces sp. E2]|eukprot:OUM61871.1 carbohydrate-binding module family 18 protein [Piromyces sp. E2]